MRTVQKTIGISSSQFQIGKRKVLYRYGYKHFFLFYIIYYIVDLNKHCCLVILVV